MLDEWQGEAGIQAIDGWTFQVSSIYVVCLTIPLTMHSFHPSNYSSRLQLLELMVCTHHR